jgi:hypothetical protein
LRLFAIPFLCDPQVIDEMTAMIPVSDLCIAGIMNDDIVTASELLLVTDLWVPTDPTPDINFDDIVDVTDLLIMVGNWGACG